MPPKQNVLQDTYTNSSDVFSQEQRQYLNFRAGSFFLNTIFSLYLLIPANTGTVSDPFWRFVINSFCVLMIILGTWKASQVWFDLWFTSIENIEDIVINMEKIQRRGPPHYNVIFEEMKLRALNKYVWASVEVGQRYRAYFTRRSKFLISAKQLELG